MAFPVKARQNTPPVSPANGDRYLVNTAPTGAWAGQANKFAIWYTSFWSFRSPVEGEETYLQNTDEWLFYDGTAWVTHPFSATGTPAATYLTPDSLGSFLTRANLNWGKSRDGRRRGDRNHRQYRRASVLELADNAPRRGRQHHIASDAPGVGLAGRRAGRRRIRRGGDDTARGARHVFLPAQPVIQRWLPNPGK
jgi:hypothetical protein